MIAIPMIIPFFSDPRPGRWRAGESVSTRSLFDEARVSGGELDEGLINL